MSVRVITAAGTLELGDPPNTRDAYRCERDGCNARASIELDIPRVLAPGRGRLRLVDNRTRRRRYCRRHLAELVGLGEAANR